MRYKLIYKISVRDLVAFVLSGGDLGKPSAGKQRAVQGIRAHQAQQQDRPPGYRAEVPVSLVTEQAGVELELSGRIDGVYTTQTPVMIEEIKTTYHPVPAPDPQHWAQLQCYAYMYARCEGLEEVALRLVYLELGSFAVQDFHACCRAAELADQVERLLEPYFRWLARTAARTEKRNRSLEHLAFPYPAFRRGQREFAEEIYRGIRQGGLLFARAPTGIGKTMAALYPALKALGKGLCTRIFYLTARTTGRLAAENALAEMRKAGLYLVHVTITAKEKICFCPGTGCNAGECAYAAGYYDKLPGALEELEQHTAFDRTAIEALARQYTVCPFEFSLDLSLSADCIICDYNYVFDPRVCLKRHFARGKVDYYLLIDEAHNLPDRARGMFSAYLDKRPVLDLKRAAKLPAPELACSLDAINKLFIAKRKLCRAGGTPYLTSTALPGDLLELVRNFAALAWDWLEQHPGGALGQQILDLYFSALNFLKIADFFAAHYITYFEPAARGNLRAALFCLDPAPQLTEVLKICRGAVFFSATLLPLDYFKQLLARDPGAPGLNLPSPFPPENMRLFVASGIATDYKQRGATYERIAALLAVVYQAKPGPYLVYFPSYAYLEQVAAVFLARYRGIKVLLQQRRMSEAERSEFLDQFLSVPAIPQVGFAVLGGIFGEGIDLAGERLIGVIVVGIGLPQLCLELDLIRNYYSGQGKNGFAYAYQTPGFNKVLQAAGRLIRSETDRGVVLLVDSRFARPDYLSLFPAEWRHYTQCRDEKKLPEQLAEFWEDGQD